MTDILQVAREARAAMVAARAYVPDDVAIKIQYCMIHGTPIVRSISVRIQPQRKVQRVS